MNIVEKYCAKNIKNKVFLENGVKILFKNKYAQSTSDLEVKKKQIEIDLATDFLKQDPDWICKECGAPIVCDYITSYYEHYTCVNGEDNHTFTVK